MVLPPHPTDVIVFNNYIDRNSVVSGAQILNIFLTTTHFVPTLKRIATTILLLAICRMDFR
jgi:hypothetical protein